MLKITRLDSENIVFEKQCCDLKELIGCAVSELTTRAEQTCFTILFPQETDFPEDKEL